MTTYYFLMQGPVIKRISLEGDPPRVAEVLQIGMIEPDCKINVSCNLPGPGFPPSILCHNQITGSVFYYWDDRGRYERSSVLGTIPPGYRLHAFLYIDPAGEFTKPKIYGHYTRSDPTDPNYGQVKIWDLDSLSTPRALGTIIGPWELMLADLNGDHQVDVLGRLTHTTHLGDQGDLAVWLSGDGFPISEVLGNRGNIGLEWKLQVADMNFDGYADIFGYNANGDLWVWHNIADPKGKRGFFSAGHSYGTFGPDWQHLQIASLRSAPPPSVDILGIANNGEVHGWFTNGTGVAGAGVNLENARGWIPLAGLPQTRFVSNF